MKEVNSRWSSYEVCMPADSMDPKEGALTKRTEKVVASRPEPQLLVQVKMDPPTVFQRLGNSPKATTSSASLSTLSKPSIEERLGKMLDAPKPE